MSYLKDIRIQGSGGYFYQDKSTSSIPTIMHEHHEVHDGDHYNIRGFTSPLSSGGTFVVQFTTPAGSKWTHLLWDVEGTTQTEVRTWEGATLSGGTIGSCFNNNRNTTNVTGMTIRFNPVVSGTSPTSGTLIGAHSKGLEGTNPTEGNLNSEISHEDEWILKSGTTYLWELKSVGAGNIIDYSFKWYEHIDRVQQF